MPSFSLPFTATRVQAFSYLLGVALFSISFLVFLNSTVSFVITDRIGQKEKVGDAVGTLGFADELVVVVACPLWGMLSDRIGLRAVAVAGYIVVGASLFVFVQAGNVYPQLLLGRMFFAVGAAATSTMVTAILPTMTMQQDRLPSNEPSRRVDGSSNHIITPSISSEVTITPTRYRTQSGRSLFSDTSDPVASTSRLSGLVGMFTGIGALVALGLFLPLPTRFQKAGKSPSEAVADAFYVVGAVALAVGIAVFFGLRNLPGDNEKGLHRLWQSRVPKQNMLAPPALPSYVQLFSRSLVLGLRDMNIGLGYLGGFVARASSVAISLFIPLFVNQYFISSGRCVTDPSASPQDPGEIKKNCQRAYIVASILSGVSQLVALLCAPIFGYLNARYAKSKLPLLVATASGIAGFTAFGRLRSPDPTAENGNVGAYFIVALIGISQIGAIVSSLDLISRGIQTKDEGSFFADNLDGGNGYTPVATADTEASTPLMPSHLRQIQISSSRGLLKGSIAGIYSLAGGVGILLLTKVGGVLFDKLDVGVPFYMMAVFNAVLFVATLGCVAWTHFKGERTQSFERTPFLSNGNEDAGQT